MHYSKTATACTINHRPQLPAAASRLAGPDDEFSLSGLANRCHNSKLQVPASICGAPKRKHIVTRPRLANSRQHSPIIILRATHRYEGGEKLGGMQ
ncbi:uncharacterized protein ANIA_11551 [Aspergillus nidulans FGSC A4]|uniref:Uncharacterized protein n=1 Tax=Emericella nidulans (strain FGSC A4 / ATCC 38163 / CBS 112.46 / NRRL 194 / M139) TaxID=227321 RepID=C8VCZ4_EMENI|nr:hypothetical protein [Aspergillus nidulans FGSC A4]CBF78827.1 TPA: hypothetical protein ANIA_11551 [Aspergillus nidulans FGSC A4]